MGWFLRLTVGILQRFQRGTPSADTAHLRTGREGETAAYLFLRERGYRIVATNYRAPRLHGEIDLIAWDGDVLCFVEVKTRVGQGLTPPEAAVDAAKRKHIRAVARAYLRRLRSDSVPPCRFDIVSITCGEAKRPDIKLLQGAFQWRRRAATAREYFPRPRREPWEPLR